MAYHYTHRLMHLKPHQRSFHSQWKLRHRFPVGHNAKNKIRGMPSPKWNIYTTLSPPKAQGSLLKRGNQAVGSYKKTVFWAQQGRYSNELSGCGSTHKTCANPNQSKSQHVCIHALTYGFLPMCFRTF